MSVEKRMRGSLLALLTLVAMSTSHAATINTKQSVDEIVAQQQQIRKVVKTEARGWDAIPLSKRNELLAKQDQLFTLLAGKQTLGDLNEQDQMEVVDRLEWIEALANNAEDERQICQRETPTGSKRTVLVCRTVAQIRKDREASRNSFRQGVKTGL